jgi:hypothetical protein
MTLWATIFFAAGSSLIVPPGGTDDPTVRQPAPIEYRGFRFLPGACETGQTACAQSGPKDWTSSEIDVVKSAIDEIVARTDGVNVVDRTQRRGATTLRRYGVLTGRLGAVPAAAALRRAGSLAWIEVYDSFFASPRGRDSYSGKPGFLVVSEILLHECMHAIDDLSGDLEFVRIAGFTRAGDRWRFAVHTADEAATLARYNDEFERLDAAGDFMAKWRLGRSTALNMRPIRVPTIHATARPTEAFAEIGAILILDPKARKYLPRDLVVYFDRNVFGRSSGSLPPELLPALHPQPDPLYRREVGERIAIEHEEVGGRSFDRTERRAPREDRRRRVN